MKPSKKARRNLPACLQCAVELGHPDLFENETTLHERKLLGHIYEIAEYRHENGHYPYPSLKLGRILARMRMGKAGTGKKTVTWFASCDDLAKELGCSDMFDKVDRENECLQRTREVAKFREKHGRYPTHRDGENNLGKWLSKMRSTRINYGIGKTKSKWYPSCLELAEELGFPDMFDSIGTISVLEQKSLDKTRKAAEYFHKNGRYPVAGKSSLGNWLTLKRSAYAGTNKTRARFYNSCLELAKELGCPDMFAQIDLSAHKKKALDRTRQTAMFKTEHGRYPRTTDGGLGAWLGNIRRSRIGRGNPKQWYPECQTLAEELGFPDMFVIERRRGGRNGGVVLTQKEIEANETASAHLASQPPGSIL